MQTITSLLSKFIRLSSFKPRTAIDVLSSRRTSIFSSFRFKRSTIKEKYEKVVGEKNDAEASKLWIEAVNDFEAREITKLNEAVQKLTRTETRRLKKRAFLHVLRVYHQRHGKTRRGFNQFAKTALDRMSAYEVQGDLDCYKAIMDLFPSERMVVTSFLQAEFGHFYRQQNTMISILQQMTHNHVMADDEVGQLIINVFGWRNHVMQHYRHMMYWYPKLFNANPWPVAKQIADDLDEDPLRLARLIAERICPDRMTDLHVVKLPKNEKVVDNPHTLMSAQSPEQRALLSHAINCRNRDESNLVLYVDGPHFVWYQRLQAAYYTLWAELDQGRMRKEVKRAENRANKLLDTDFAHLPSTNHMDPRVDQTLEQIQFMPSRYPSLVDVISLPTSPNHTNLPEANENIHTYDMNSSLMKNPSSQLNRIQPEYDNRWLALRHTHAYTFLPNHLTAHEQVEGIILAVGIVSPMPDALDMQKQLFTDLISHELDPQSDSSVKRSYIHIPVPAPPSLIHLWLKELEIRNPTLSNSTVVIRIPNVDSVIDSHSAAAGKNFNREYYAA